MFFISCLFRAGPETFFVRIQVIFLLKIIKIQFEVVARKGSLEAQQAICMIHNAARPSQDRQT